MNKAPEESNMCVRTISHPSQEAETEDMSENLSTSRSLGARNSSVSEERPSPPSTSNSGNDGTAQDTLPHNDGTATTSSPDAGQVQGRLKADDEEGKKTTTQINEYSYRNYSQVLPKSLAMVSSGRVSPGGTNSMRVQKLPTKLSAMLSCKEFEHIISWMPHGRAWKIHNPHAFVEEVIPRFFDNTNYNSFIRLVNAWGFRRVMKGTDRNAYYHELFLRGMPHLHATMHRLTANEKKAPLDPENEPDFYRISELFPLPPIDEPKAFLPGVAALSNSLLSGRQPDPGLIGATSAAVAGGGPLTNRAAPLGLESLLVDDILATEAIARRLRLAQSEADSHVREQSRLSAARMLQGGTLPPSLQPRLGQSAPATSLAAALDQPSPVGSSGFSIPHQSRMVPGRLGSSSLGLLAKSEMSLGDQAAQTILAARAASASLPKPQLGQYLGTNSGLPASLLLHGSRLDDVNHGLGLGQLLPSARALPGASTAGGLAPGNLFAGATRHINLQQELASIQQRQQQANLLDTRRAMEIEAGLIREQQERRRRISALLAAGGATASATGIRGEHEERSSPTRNTTS